MVLAKIAVKIAAGRGDRKRTAAGMEMIKRLFFDGIDVQGDRLLIIQCIKHSVLILADVTKTILARGENTGVGTKMALDPAAG
jgi:hypothetical protein